MKQDWARSGHNARPRRVWIRTRIAKQHVTYSVLRYCHETGRVLTAYSARDKFLAQQFARELERWINGHAEHPSAQRRFNNRHAANDWQTAVNAYLAPGKFKPKSAAGYRWVLERFAAETGVVTLAQVDAALIDGWLSKYRQGSAATPANYLRILAALLRWALRDDSPITRELTSRWRPYARRKRSRPVIYAPEQFAAMLDAAEGVSDRARYRTPAWWRAYLSVLYYAGLRREEASRLIWRDVDFATGLVRVQPHNKIQGVLAWSPKGVQRRTIHLPAEAIDRLVTLQQHQPPGIPYVFLSADRYASLLGRAEPTVELLTCVTTQFKALRIRAGVMEGTLHDFRRTFVTRLLRAGVKPHEAQALAGHRDVQTTLSIYNEVDQEAALDAMRRVNQFGSAKQRTISATDDAG